METEPVPEENRQHLSTVLLAHEQARARAWIGKNRQALEILLAPDFIEINALGRLSRAEVLGQLFSSLTLQDFAIEQPELLLTGTQSAILTYRCREDLTVNGEQITGTFHVAAHYVRRKNKWLLLLWQITPWTAP
jgi:hypothetical protein